MQDATYRKVQHTAHILYVVKRDAHAHGSLSLSTTQDTQPQRQTTVHRQTRDSRTHTFYPLSNPNAATGNADGSGGDGGAEGGKGGAGGGQLITAAYSCDLSPGRKLSSGMSAAVSALWLPGEAARLTA